MATAITPPTALRDVCERLEAAEGSVPLGTTTAQSAAADTLQDGIRLLYADADTDALGSPVVRIDAAATASVAYSPAVTINDAGGISATDTTVVYASTGDPIVANDVILIESEKMLVTAVVAATNTLTITRGYDGTTAATHADGLAIAMVVTASGSYSVVKLNGLAPTTGIVTVSPPFRGRVQSGTNYSLWKTYHPVPAQNAMNRVLRRMRREQLLPISLVADADMETTGVTNWTATGDEALTKSTTASQIVHGSQSLRIAAVTAIPDVRYATDLQVIAGDQYIFSGNLLSVGDDLITLQARDPTAGATIASGSHRQGVFMEIDLYPVVIPTGALTLRFRILGSTTGDDIYVENAIVWPVNRGWFDLPSWIEDPADILGVGYFERGTALIGTNAYTIQEGSWVPWPYETDWVEESGARPMRIRFQTPVCRPLYIRLMRPFAEMTADTDTTTADRALLVNLTLREIYRDLALNAATSHDAELQGQWRERVDDIEKITEVQAWLTRFNRQTRRVVYPTRYGRRW